MTNLGRPIACTHRGNTPGSPGNRLCSTSEDTAWTHPLRAVARRSSENFGHSIKSTAYLYQPSNIESLRATFHYAAQAGLTIAPRGAARSYNDASLNSGGIVMDLTGMAAILSWDPDTGIVTAQPGATLQHLWQRVLPDGWWPPVVSGTMFTTWAVAWA